MFDKAGAIGRSARDIAFSHGKVHHQNLDEKEKLDSELSALGAVGEKIKKVRYGLTVGVDAVLYSLAFTMPVHATLIWTLGLSPLAAAVLFAPSLLFPLASRYFHPFVHDRQSEALAEANPFWKWFLQTRYAEMMARLHYGHHKGRGGNYNLIFGADWLMGQLRKPNLEQILRMQKEELIGAFWSELAKYIRGSQILGALD